MSISYGRLADYLRTADGQAEVSASSSRIALAISNGNHVDQMIPPGDGSISVIGDASGLPVTDGNTGDAVEQDGEHLRVGDACGDDRKVRLVTVVRSHQSHRPMGRAARRPLPRWRHHGHPAGECTPGRRQAADGNRRLLAECQGLLRQSLPSTTQDVDASL